MEMVEDGDLVIRDLAYMHLSALGKFVDKGVSFLCRLNTKTKAYQLTGGKFKELNLLRFFFEGNRFKLAAFFKEFYEVSRVSHLLEKKGSQETSIELLEKSLMLMDVGNQNELKMAA